MKHFRLAMHCNLFHRLCDRCSGMLKESCLGRTQRAGLKLVSE